MLEHGFSPCRYFRLVLIIPAFNSSLNLLLIPVYLKLLTIANQVVNGINGDMPSAEIGIRGTHVVSGHDFLSGESGGSCGDI